MDKTITVTIDSELMDAISIEMKQKRNLGSATSLGDVFLIRFLSAAENNSKVLSLHRKKNKTVVREFTTPPVNDLEKPNSSNVA